VNVACNILSIIPHCGAVELSNSVVQEVIGWKQSKSTGETLCKTAIVRQFARANTGIMAGNDTALHTTDIENDVERKKDADERSMHRMAMVHDFLEMRQGNQNLHAILKESHVQNKQMTAITNISHKEKMFKVSWSLFQHDGMAAFELSD
jgi:hypothetical protein